MTLLLAILTAWTNTASRVIVAEPLRLEGKSVVMKMETGRERVFPLAVFPLSERARLKAALGVRELTGCLEEQRRIFALEFLRTEQRHAGGAMTDEEFNDKVDRLYKGWAWTLEKSELSREDKEFWKGRIK